MRKLNQHQYEILQEMNYPLLLLLEAEEVNSDSEPHPDDKDAPQNQGQDQSQQPPEEQDQDPQPSEEEIFQAENAGTQDKFVQFILYDKLAELSNKIETIRNNIQIRDPEFDNEFNDKLNYYAQYVEVLNEIIFSVSTSTVYNIVGQLEIELISLLESYIKFHGANDNDNNQHKGLR